MILECWNCRHTLLTMQFHNGNQTSFASYGNQFDINLDLDSLYRLPSFFRLFVWLQVFLPKMVAVDHRFHACVDHIRERKLVRQGFCACSERIKAKHGVALGVISAFPADEDYLPSVLHRTEVHPPKVLDFPDGAAADLFRELYHVAVCRDDENMAVADDSARQTTSKRQIREVRGLANTSIVALNGRAVPVVALRPAEDKDLLPENGC